MSARENILNRLRQYSEQRSKRDPETSPVTAFKLSNIGEDLLNTFIAQAEKSGATVLRTQTPEDADALLRALRSENPDCQIANADAAIAETGTLCLHSHKVASRSLFLCEHLVAVIRAGDILACQEDYWQAVSETPRALHLITGPSRTADVEQTLQIGAHGAKEETIIVIAGHERRPNTATNEL